MFGYLIADPRFLTAKQKTHYRSLYCGLCKQLANKYGWLARFFVHYDMVFLLLLDVASDDEGAIGIQRCPRHFLFKNCKYQMMYHTPFLADVTILLGYWQKMDQKQDEGSLMPCSLLVRWKQETKRIQNEYPAIYSCIKEQLSQLRVYEVHGEININLPAATFGKITRVIFEHVHPKYGDFGQNVGKFIYLMDAACDLKHDLRHELYNPFVRCSHEEQEHLLHCIGQLCLDQLTQFPLENIKMKILENILARGMWLKYYGIKGGEILEKSL